MSPTEPSPIRGGPLLREIREAYQQHYRSTIEQQGRRMAILRFTTDESGSWAARMDASRVSAEQKVRNFEALGYEVEHVVLPDTVSPAEFGERLDRCNEQPEMTGIIVQFPPPARLQAVVATIDPAKDVDGLLGPERSPYPAPATSEGISRLVEPFLLENPHVAVVGSAGFIGSGVMTRLQQQGADVHGLDLGDDLTEVRHADIVISVTGRPVLTGEHLGQQHHLLVDSGFLPSPDGSVQGDLSPEAAHRAHYVTPVPGGMGPVEMGVLLERLVAHDADPTLAPWRYLGPGAEHHTSLGASAPHADQPDTQQPRRRAVSTAANAFSRPPGLAPSSSPGNPGPATPPASTHEQRRGHEDGPHRAR